MGKGIKNDPAATTGKCPLIKDFVSMAIGQYSLGIYKNTLIQAQRNQLVSMATKRTRVHNDH